MGPLSMLVLVPLPSPVHHLYSVLDILLALATPFVYIRAAKNALQNPSRPTVGQGDPYYSKTVRAFLKFGSLRR